MARYKETGHKNWKDFPSKACFQMNDTHPTIAVAELMRLLIDQEGLDWEEAWSITTQVNQSTALPRCIYSLQLGIPTKPLAHNCVAQVPAVLMLLLPCNVTIWFYDCT